MADTRMTATEVLSRRGGKQREEAEAEMTTCHFCGKKVQMFTSLAHEYECQVEQLNPDIGPWRHDD